MMRVTGTQFIPACGCRSVGECSHGAFAELKALDALVDQFAAAMKAKLHRSAMERGRSGWDDPSWPIDDVRAALLRHVEKGDPVDVANFAAFWWNKQ